MIFICREFNFQVPYQFSRIVVHAFMYVCTAIVHMYVYMYFYNRFLTFVRICCLRKEKGIVTSWKERTVMMDNFLSRFINYTTK